MELTFESAFSSSGVLGHLSYILLILSMLNANMFWLRVGVIGSALAGIAYAIFILSDPVAAFWESLLLIVNLLHIIRLVLAERGVVFSPEEDQIVMSVFRDLSSLEARRLLDKGFWLDHDAGQELIREGSAVEHLYYLYSGRAEVRSAGKIVGHCGPRDLIGEGTILSSDKATGTVTLSENSRLWCVPAPTLRKHLDKNPTVRSVIDRRIGDALKSKLRAANVAMSESGGLAS